MDILAFDIETIPDTENGRRIYGLADAEERDIGEAMFAKQREKSGGSDFLPVHLHKVVAMAVVYRRGRDQLRISAVGKEQDGEKGIIAKFFKGLEFTPRLVTWNGSRFDLPVLHYRALLHGVASQRYWDTGEHDREFRWDNYFSRYHFRHTDLMDVLAAYNPRAFVSLDEAAMLLGLPGKSGMDGGKVWERCLAGDIQGIRNYCQLDALNTYLIYLRWELIRGNFSERKWREECDLVREKMQDAGLPHFEEFLDAWHKSESQLPGPEPGNEK